MNGTNSVLSSIEDIRATGVRVDDDTLTVDLEDGRSITAPIIWYPRLEHGNAKERSRYKIVGQGTAIHWPDLDEDLSVSSIILGRKSGESRQSFERWMAARREKQARTHIPVIAQTS